MRTKKNELRATAMNLLNENLHPDNLGGAKGGTLVCRWTYLFTKGGEEAQRYAQAVTELLSRNQIPHTIVDSGDMWQPWHKNATVAQQSHFYVEVKIAA